MATGCGPDGKSLQARGGSSPIDSAQPNLSIKRMFSSSPPFVAQYQIFFVVRLVVVFRAPNARGRER